MPDLREWGATAPCEYGACRLEVAICCLSASPTSDRGDVPGRRRGRERDCISDLAAAPLTGRIRFRLFRGSKRESPEPLCSLSLYSTSSQRVCTMPGGIVSRN